MPAPDSQRTTDPPEPDDSSGRSRIRVGVSALLALAAAIAYLCRNSLPVAEKTIREDLNLSEDAMGFVLGPAFFWAYALSQIPGAWLGKRFGSRRVLPAFLTVSSIATALFGLARGLPLFLFGRVAGGVAQAGQFPCSASTISRWHPRTERALASGVLGAAMSVGGAIGAGLTGELIGLWHWRWVFVLYSLPGLVWAAWFFGWFRDDPAQHDSVNEAELDHIREGEVPEEESSPSEPTPWMAMVTSPPMWMICGQQFFRAAGYAFFASWFATYLQETRNVSTAKSGWLLMVPLLATVAASISGGAFSDMLHRRTGSAVLSRKSVAAVALAVCGVLVFSAWFVQDATLATCVIAAGVFFAAVAGPCAYAITIDMGGRHVSATFAVMNMIGNFAAGLLPWLVPAFRRLVDRHDEMLRLSGGNSWNAVLFLFAAMYFFGAACWALMNVRGTIFDHALIRSERNVNDE